jgi:hypothetical protein
MQVLLLDRSRLQSRSRAEERRPQWLLDLASLPQCLDLSPITKWRSTPDTGLNYHFSIATASKLGVMQLRAGCQERQVEADRPRHNDGFVVFLMAARYSLVQ